MAAIRFGTDGWRAVIAEDFTFDNVRVCAQAAASYVQDAGLGGLGLIVGYDTRFASEDFAKAVAEVVAGNGVRVQVTEKATPTPAVSHSILQQRAAGAVVITASHNPGIWNGFKYKPEYAGSASPEVIGELENRIAAVQAGKMPIQRVPYEAGMESGLIQQFDPRPDYFKQLLSLVDVEAIQASGLNVAVDAMYGAGMGYFPALLDGGESRIFEVNNVRNPIFPGMNNPEPLAHNLTALAQAVSSSSADVGLANDGDADRVGMMDEKSGYVNALQVYALLLLYLLEVRQMRGPIVKSLSTTVMAKKLAEKYGAPVYETPVGFKYIGPKMLEVGAIMGGEESGGFAFAGHIPERDGILAGLYLLDFMVKTGRKPSELIDHLYSIVGPHYYDRVDHHFSQDEREMIRSRLDACCDDWPDALAGVRVTGLDTMDGYRFTFVDGGWLLIRMSGTEPIVRIYTETTREDKVAPLLEAGAELLQLC
jgi:alpha-D-glucose phosphate-specific phosphoglucomutase